MGFDIGVYLFKHFDLKPSLRIVPENVCSDQSSHSGANHGNMLSWCGHGVYVYGLLAYKGYKDMLILACTELCNTLAEIDQGPFPSGSQGLDPLVCQLLPRSKCEDRVKCILFMVYDSS